LSVFILINQLTTSVYGLDTGGSMGWGKVGLLGCNSTRARE